MQNGQARLDVAGLREIAALILQRAGSSAENAAVVATHLVESEMLGRLSHALRLLPTYVARLQKGEVDGHARPEIVQDWGATLRISGRRGFGQVAGDFAVDQGVARAREFGISLVGLNQSGHLGRNGRWSERAADHGMASIHFGHSARGAGQDFVVPFGGTEPRMRTSPVSYGAPDESGRHVILDFAIGEISANAVMLAAERGVPLATPALIGRDGKPTDDPTALAEGRAGLRPFGGFKGYGLALFAEIFAGILAGDGEAGHRSNSLLSIYIDLRRQRNWTTYSAELRAMLDHIRSAPPVAGSQGVRIPGERRPDQIASAERDGLAAEAHLVEALRDAAARSQSLDVLADRWPEVFPG